MRTVIVYESMFGSTRRVAQSMAEGFGPGADVRVVRVADAGPEVLEGADLLVVGGPTHFHGMSRPASRKRAPGYAAKPESGLALEPGADTGPGVREWMAGLTPRPLHAVAFDTRFDGLAPFTGRASKAIARRLRKLGMHMVSGPESFLVGKKGQPLPGECDRARAFGARLATMLARLEPSGAG